MKKYWWKILSGILLLYAVIFGFIVDVPVTMIEQTMRTLFYHGMFAMLFTGFIYSLRYLSKFDEREDVVAVEAVNVGMMFGFLGIFTGMVWATFTWGTPWVKDPKLNGAAVGLFIYMAYIILRGSIEDGHKKAKVSAVYNIFAFILWIVFVLILPRLSGPGLHPATGNDATPVLPMHMDSSMRTVFYPAMIGWALLGFWILSLRVRIRRIMTSDE
jgi:heme exporter protein C